MGVYLIHTDPFILPVKWMQLLSMIRIEYFLNKDEY